MPLISDSLRSFCADTVTIRERSRIRPRWSRGGPGVIAGRARPAEIGVDVAELHSHVFGLTPTAVFGLASNVWLGRPGPGPTRTA